MQKNNYTNFSGSSLNTLAQSGTYQTKKPALKVGGSGTELSNLKALKGRGKRKLITQTMVLSLIDIAIKRGNIKNLKAFWNTFHCQNKVVVSNGRLYGKYCKNRFCTLCLANRKADIINRYLPVIKHWEQPYFVTLTVKAVPARLLNRYTKGLLRAWEKIYQRCKKRNQRGTGIKLMGIKSLECNFNPRKRTYNPHLHIIVPSEEIADLLISEWMKQWKGNINGDYVLRVSQHKRKVIDTQRDLIEIVKYGSKIFTEPDIDTKSRSGISQRVYAAALYNIFEAMKGLRIFDRFGFNLPKEASRQSKGTVLMEYEEWEYNPYQNDWEAPDNTKPLTGYAPTFQLMELLKNNIDCEVA